MSHPNRIVQLPRLPAPDFFARAENSILSRDGTAILTFDPATRSGFIHQVQTGNWLISSPTTFEHFAMLAHAAGYAIDDTADARRWMAACGAPVSPGYVSLSGGARH